MRDDIIEASRDSNASITIDRSSAFEGKVSRSKERLVYLDAVAVQLQKRFRTLSACRCDIAIIQQNIEKAKNKPDRRRHGCNLVDE